jgi:hypothetical protein
MLMFVNRFDVNDSGRKPGMNRQKLTVSGDKFDRYLKLLV